MASFRNSRFPFILAVLFGILVCVFAAPARASSVSQPSPPADTDLICHTSNPSECYPRVFQPTDEFQVVHDDQELPNGLHVRMNIWTGLKEAKINVPGEGDAALEGLPVDQDIIVVDPEQPEPLRVPKGAPAYDAVGKIKEPSPEQQYEGQKFFEAVKMMKKGYSGLGKEFDVALEGMEELAHDIYYGLKVTEDPAVVKTLFCMMGDDDGAMVDGITPRDQQAAAILAGALSNNAAALKEVTKQWPDLMADTCKKGSRSLGESFYDSFMPSPIPTGPSAQKAASRVKAKVAAINNLLKSDEIRSAFLQNGGMARLLEVLSPEGKEWATAQRRVGQLVLDTFLDEDMGAKLGQWPREPRTDDDEACKKAGAGGEGCWDYQVERIMKANKRDKEHWSRDLHERLAALRKSEKGSRREEL